VLPLLAFLSAFFGILPPIPDAVPVEYRGDVQNVMSGMIPRIYNHSYAISADLAVPAGGAEGVIVAEADHLGGFSLWVADGKLTHTYSMMGVFIYRQQADEPLPAGEVTVRMEFAADAAKPATGGEVTLYINDRPVGKGRMDHTVPIRFSAYAGMPSADRRSQLSGNARASAVVMPAGSVERRRPVTGSAACDRSTPASPSMTQKRRNARSPQTKFWVALTDMATDRSSTAVVTSAVVMPASSVPGRNSWRKRRA
jgi:hypothetical protein